MRAKIFENATERYGKSQVGVMDVLTAEHTRTLGKRGHLFETSEN